MVIGYIIVAYLLGFIFGLVFALPFVATRHLKSVAGGASAEIRGS